MKEQLKDIHLVDDQQVKKDFLLIAQKMGLSNKKSKEYVESWYEQYLKLTNNDNNLKISFLFCLDEYQGIVKEALHNFEEFNDKLKRGEL